MFTLNCRGRLLVLDRPAVMGIINITPDSFYAGSRMRNMDEVLRLADLMLSQGASILDIGGQSTRPGSEQVGADKELERITDPVAAIHKRFPEAILSVDTYYARVAREAVSAGASIVNDISGGQLDPDMLSTVASLQAPYVLMHMKGTAADMHMHTEYGDLTAEVLDYLATRLQGCYQAGIRDVIVDPGFGFSKTIAQNFEILRNLRMFQMLKAPVLLGLSRKSTVYKSLGVSPEEALNGTTVLNTIGLLNGAAILRVHDVKEAKEAITLVQACMKIN